MRFIKWHTDVYLNGDELLFVRFYCKKEVVPATASNITAVDVGVRTGETFCSYKDETILLMQQFVCSNIFEVTSHG